MDLTYRTLCDCTSEDVAAAFLRIFEDYAVPPPPHFDGAAFERRFRSEHLDRAASQLVTCGPDPVATILVARRGRTSHISGLGVAAAYRHAGLARRLLTAACQEAQQRGDTRMLVEVLTTDATAGHLYESCGFVTRRRLVGFTKVLSSAMPAGQALEIDTGTVAELVASEGATDLPWFLHPASLAGCSLPTRAYELDGRAYAVATLRGSELHFRALLVRPDARRRGLARRLIDIVAFSHSAKVCTVFPYVPEGLCDEFFAAASFQKLSWSNSELERRF